ncbi:exonuclease RecJ [Nitrosomonas cryotolerans]|uniref:Single-stranded-DNA-specific exonuclease RecJ n=1 Tax=Nitrosomonas cryotolerans ATCC 49181 TaxID=1131553 RepID=A0A1N6GRH3_9PROT|nr:single-stranded-DNA-specific exonuclease RecJ [Nitrosomonas cryotolerans]SFP40040.1 exonuclease RecJ [Nitrosomonas cryotolerans]SIO10150.1 exonuclease RecJ [Nitrosomonas cryotolerans ATCC 49181]
MAKITVRNYSSQAFNILSQSGLPPVLARIYAARGIEETHQLETELSCLLPFDQFKNIIPMAASLADAILAKKRLLIIADYDSDGATACTVGMRVLRKLGATVDYLVPNRFEYGYGLTPEIVQLAHTTKQPDILITVDNGIASIAGVRTANQLGMQVFVTDHHLPGDELPDAAAIMNPNQPGCHFPSKNIAGVGVIFYLMLALRAELRKRGVFMTTSTHNTSHQSGAIKEPNLASLLDLVALGTVADVVKLDDNNRILVQQGLQRIRKGRACAGINALLKITRRDYHQTSAYELGFVLGPRLNAAGRLDDMSLGIECLITDDETHATHLAQQLDELNSQRREIESDMQESALQMLAAIIEKQHANIDTSYSLCLFDPEWHQGVIGILASRIKDQFHRPVITFAPGNGGELKGSGRSIGGFHLRDALDLVSKRHPELILKFGGHAAAAGLTINSDNFEQFREAFEQAAQALLTPADLTRVIETDGQLDETEICLELAHTLTQQVWGQGFPPPTFNASFYVEEQRIVGEKHLKLKLRKCSLEEEQFQTSVQSSDLYDAILFAHSDPLPEIIDAVYRLQINQFRGNTTLQIQIDHWSQSERWPTTQ